MSLLSHERLERRKSSSVADNNGQYFQLTSSSTKTFLHLHFKNKMLFGLSPYAKMFGSDEHLIQFFLSIYPVLLFPPIPFNPIKANVPGSQYSRGAGAFLPPPPL